MQVVVEVPESAVLAMSPEVLGQRIKLYAALFMYRAGELSAGAACDFADIDRYTFLDECRRLGIETLHLGDDDLAGEVAWPGEAIT